MIFSAALSLVLPCTAILFQTFDRGWIRVAVVEVPHRSLYQLMVGYIVLSAHGNAT